MSIILHRFMFVIYVLKTGMFFIEIKKLRRHVHVSLKSTKTNVIREIRMYISPITT